MFNIVIAHFGISEALIVFLFNRSIDYICHSTETLNICNSSIDYSTKSHFFELIELETHVIETEYIIIIGFKHLPFQSKVILWLVYVTRTV